MEKRESTGSILLDELNRSRDYYSPVTIPLLTDSKTAISSGGYLYPGATVDVMSGGGYKTARLKTDEEMTPMEVEEYRRKGVVYFTSA